MTTKEEAKLHADLFRVGVKGIPDQLGHGENRLRDADLPLKVVASNFDVDLLHGRCRLWAGSAFGQPSTAVAADLAGDEQKVTDAND